MEEEKKKSLLSPIASLACLIHRSTFITNSFCALSLPSYSLILLKLLKLHSFPTL
jgi:hypothetical protein